MELDKVVHYLTAMAGAARAESRTTQAWPFVTISRQAGAGGHALAEALLAEFTRRREEPLFQGWQLFDDEICRQVAANPKLKVLARSLAAERFTGPLEDFLTHALAGTSPQDTVARETFRVIAAVAAAGKSVIVGRGAACLLRHLPGGVQVRLIAPVEHRLPRVMERLDLDERAAQGYLRQRDGDRARLVRRWFRRDIEDPLLYDCVWNTADVPPKSVALALLPLLEERTLELRRTALDSEAAGALRRATD